MLILHTADWHLGRIFHGVHLTEDQAQILTQIIDVARQVRPDVVLIAGDIFDRPVPPAEAVALLDEVLSCLVVELGLKVVVIPGNHDSPERLCFGGRLFERQGLYVVTAPLGKHLIFEDRHGKVHFYAFPYLSYGVLRSLFKEPPEATLIDLWARLLPTPPDRRSVLCTHAFVQGGKDSPSEMLLVGGADLLPPELFKAYSFSALGHLHRFQTIEGRIHYPGAPMAYSFREAGTEKGISLVEIDAKGGVNIEFIPLSPPRELLVLEGNFHELLLAPRKEALVKVVLLDKEPIFEAFRRLKEVFPYLVSLEQPYFQGVKGASLGEKIQGQEEDLLFRGFMKEVTGAPPTEEDETLFQEMLNTLRSN